MGSEVVEISVSKRVSKFEAPGTSARHALFPHVFASRDLVTCSLPPSLFWLTVLISLPPNVETKLSPCFQEKAIET